MGYGIVGDAWDVADLRAEYDILGEIGRGGTAVVYRARDCELGRDVAVKVVHPRPTSPDDDPVARLAREARTAAQLHHPNIVAVYAVRRLRGGGLALVMQLVPGDTLKTLVQREGPIAPAYCERVLRDVASALAYAHARGVVHRDVKPENIFLDADTGRAMLADFGIARIADADSMTMTGTAVGTPFYMSPEQVDGGAVDGRSDLYSLGLVAWELLTGRRPWDGESLYNVIYKQKHEELPPIEALRSGVPMRLQYLVERMLQKRPAARWAGAEGLLAQLGHSVLPEDYAHWQRAHRARLAHHHKAAERRAAEQPARSPSADATPTAAATLHFARAGSPAGSAAGALPPATVLPQPGETIELRAPGADDTPDTGTAPTYTDAVDPVWRAADELRAPGAIAWPRSRARLLAATTATALLMGGAVAHSYRTPKDDARPTTSAVDRRRSSEAVPTSATSARDVGAHPTTWLGSAHLVLTAGGRHTCALGLVGTAYCWGANERGQLGDGTVEPHSSPTGVTGVFTFTSLSVGGSHSCATTRLGDVYCWGGDARGQLGDGTTVRRTAPVRVVGAATYASVTAGATHTCAATGDGALRCWGANDQGQLGDGTRTGRATPGPVQLPEAVVTAAAGGQHTCAVVTSGGVFCWGANTHGQLGTAADGAWAMPSGPVALPRPVVSLSAGTAHTCALTDDGAGWCWGRNDAGQLGDGTRVGRLSPARVRVASGRALVRMSSGAAHTCALDAAGEVWCWGRSEHGAVGDGTAVARPQPIRVRLPEPAIAVAAGTAHSCATTRSGATLCWGGNAEGQLGDGTRRDRAFPTQVQVPSAALLARRSGR